MFFKSNYDIKIIHENTYNNVYCITVYLCLLCFYGDGVNSCIHTWELLSIRTLTHHHLAA